LAPGGFGHAHEAVRREGHDVLADVAVAVVRAGATGVFPLGLRHRVGGRRAVGIELLQGPDDAEPLGRGHGPELVPRGSDAELEVGPAVPDCARGGRRCYSGHGSVAPNLGADPGRAGGYDSRAAIPFRRVPTTPEGNTSIP